MRFYFDEDVTPQVAVMAHARGLDVVSCHARNDRRLPDDEILRLAALDGRCVVTRNRDHFIRWTVRFFEHEWPHAGVLIVPYSLPNSAPARIARALAEYVRAYQQGLASYTLDWLPGH